MPRFSLTFLVMLFAIVSGCATVAEMPSAALRAQKSVTVVASFGDTMSLQHVGTTVFNNVQSTQRVDGWKLSEAAARAGAKIHGDGQVFGQIFEDDGTLAKHLADYAPSVNAPYWKHGYQGEAVALAAAACKTDYALFIRPHTTGDYLAGTNQFIFGYGIFQRGVLGFPNRPSAFANVNVHMVDCAKRARTGVQIAYKHTPFAHELVKERDLQLTPDQVAGAVKEIEVLAEAAIREAFAKLELLAR